MKKISIRDDSGIDLNNKIDEFIDNNVDFIVKDVKALFETSKNLKFATKKVILDFLAKETLGKTVGEAQESFENNPETLDDFNRYLHKIEEVHGETIKGLIEKHLTERIVDAFLTSTELNPIAVKVIQKRIMNL